MTSYRTSAAFKDLCGALPAPDFSPHVCNARNGFTDQYGALYDACRYAGIAHPAREFNAVWHHGCIPPWLSDLDYLSVLGDGNRDLPVYVARRQQEKVLLDGGYPRVRAIGLPILYGGPGVAERIRGSLLIMPAHTLSETAVEINEYKTYIDLLLRHCADFDLIVCSLHESCYNRPALRAVFEASGIPVVRGAFSFDQNSLARSRYLFQRFEFMTTNGFGSHIPYALHFGGSVSIFGKELLPAPTNVKNIEALKNPTYRRKALAEDVQRASDAFLEGFSTVPGAKGAPPSESSAWLGADCLVSRAEMLGILQNGYQLGKAAVLGLQCKRFASRLHKQIFAAPEFPH